MPGLYPIDNHAEIAQERLAQIYRKPLIEGIEAVYMAEVQALENAIWQMASERGIVVVALDDDVQFAEAIGHQLDVVGKILKQPRGNLTDADYRLALRAKIKVLRSSGTVEELIAVFKCVEPDALISIATLPPAYFTLTISTVITAAQAVLYRLFLRQARAAGVAGVLLWQESTDATCLTLSDSAAFPETDTLTGLGDTADPTAGGNLTGAGS